MEVNHTRAKDLAKKRSIRPLTRGARLPTQPASCIGYSVGAAATVPIMATIQA